MSLYKLIESDSFFNDTQDPVVSVVNFDADNHGSLTKQAADERVNDFVSTISPEPGKFYLHILALGAGEYFGSNRNGDFFPEQNLIDYYKTFETSPSYIYRNHVNKDPARSIGKVIYAIYNDRMHRVEVVAEVDKELGKDILQRIEAGDYPATSMACKTPYDVCSICGNKASTRQDYCEHLRVQLNKMYPDGRKVMALNVAPLTFFDQSIVVRPADVTSSVLQKVANERGMTIGSAEMAEIEGLGDDGGLRKSADLNKLSEIVKEVEGSVVDADINLDNILAKTKDPEHKVIDNIKVFSLNDIFHSFAEMGISPSVEFLSELIAKKTIGDHMEGCGSVVAQLMERTGNKPLSFPEGLDKTASDRNARFLISKSLSGSLEGSSLLPAFVEKRASSQEMPQYLPRGNIGFVGNTHLQPTPFERYMADPANSKPEGMPNLLKVLLGIGGAAIAAKWFINQVIKQHAIQNAQHSDKSVKIVIVKSASDYNLTYSLANASFIRSVKDLSKGSKDRV